MDMPPLRVKQLMAEIDKPMLNLWSTSPIGQEPQQTPVKTLRSPDRRQSERLGIVR